MEWTHKLIILIMAMAFKMPCKSQSLSFTYDAAGNQTKRQWSATLMSSQVDSLGYQISGKIPSVPDREPKPLDLDTLNPNYSISAPFLVIPIRQPFISVYYEKTNRQYSHMPFGHIEYDL